MIMASYTITHDLCSHMSSRYTHKALKHEITRAKEALEHFPHDKASLDYWRYYIELCEVTLATTKDSAPSYTINASELKKSLNLTAYIGRFTELHTSGIDRYSGLCPLHHDTAPSLFVYSARHDWYCFGCLKGGDVFNFIMFYNDCSFREALALANSELRGSQLSEVWV